MMHLQSRGQKNNAHRENILLTVSVGGACLEEAALTKAGKTNQEATQTIMHSQRPIGRKDI